jgi:hypothetical protein
MLKRASIFVVTIIGAAQFAGCANAADLGWRPGYGSYSGYSRAGTTRVFEFDNGEDPYYVRRYWDEPWLNRHYYPAADEKPVYGRVERIPAADRRLPKPAEDYFRYWYSQPGYQEEIQRLPPPAPYDPKSEIPPQK